MSIRVEDDWWKSLFDEIYLVTDARSVDDDALTDREVELLCKLTPVKPGHKILDLCGGQGRHSMALCRRGFCNCTVFDYSDTLLRIGTRRAKRLNLPIEFVQGDARNIQLPAADFHHVLILGNSLGYAGDSGDDLQILREAHRLLNTGGGLAIDVTDGRAVRQHFTPNTWHEIGDDIVVCRQRELKDHRINAREMVINKKTGLVRDKSYGIRLYDPKSIQSLMSKAGFGRIRVHLDFKSYRGNGDVGFMNHRMLATARKE